MILAVLGIRPYRFFVRFMVVCRDFPMQIKKYMFL